MNKRLLGDVLPLRIIREVEKWPVIYKKDNIEMMNHHFKQKVWHDVAKNLFDNFEYYSPAEKETKVSDLIKKWRSLRDTFKRHLMVERKIRQGYNIKKKEYVYFKHMSFLLPHMADKEPRETADQTTKTNRRRAHVSQPSIVSRPEQDTDQIDEDKHFLLSLLPSFKRMNDDEKLTAKMEILKVIKDVKNSSVGIETFTTEDTLTLGNTHMDYDPGVPVVVKNESLTVETCDYKPESD